MTTHHESDCRAFEERLEAYLEGRLGSADLELSELHLAACATCRELVAPFAADDGGASGDAGFVDRVLRATSGPSCRSCEERLDGFVRGELDSGEMSLVRAHVAACAGCRALAGTLVWVGHMLPAMASLEPDARFVADVLAATSRSAVAIRIRPSLWDRARALFARPRFALEGAYLGTLFLALGVATPISPWRAAPGQLLALLQREPSVAAQSLAQWADRSAAWPSELWASASKPGPLPRTRVAGVLHEGGDVLSSTWRCVRAMGGALLGGELRATNEELRRLGRDVEELQESLRLGPKHGSQGEREGERAFPEGPAPGTGKGDTTKEDDHEHRR